MRLRDVVLQNGQVYEVERTNLDGLQRELLSLAWRHGRPPRVPGPLYFPGISATSKTSPPRRKGKRSSAATDSVAALKDDFEDAIARFAAVHHNENLRKILVSKMEEMLTLVKQHLGSSRV